MWFRGVVVCTCLFSRRQVEWEAASSLIEGICLTLQRQPIISFLPHLRSLINVCVNLVWDCKDVEKQSCFSFFFFSIFLSFLVGWFVWSVVRWWVWSAPPVWRTGCHSSTSALTCLRLCPLAPPWSDWLLCRFRYGEMTLSNTHS